MNVIESSVEVLWTETGEQMMRRIEEAGRTAYKSEDKITEGSADEFVRMLVRRLHLSVLEHVSVSARVVCDRGVSHEIVRHRIASYTQESTRFCNYSKGRFGGELTFIEPSGFDASWTILMRQQWYNAMKEAEEFYLAMIKAGASPQQARSVLPNSLKTEIVMTMNLREWVHFFKLRTAASAHPDMRRVALDLLREFDRRLPVIFCDGRVAD